MKKAIFSLLLLGSIAANAATKGDALVDKEFNKVSLTKDSDREDKKGTVDASFHLNLGLGTMTSAPSGYDFRLWPSWEFGVTVTADWYPFGNQNSWSIGFGVDWRRYRMSSNSFLIKDSDGMMIPLDFAPFQTNRHSSLNVFSLTVPVYYTHRFDKENRWSVSVGGFVNFNTSANAMQRYTIDNYDTQIKTYDIGYRPITFDFFLGVRTPVLPFYVKYSPTTFFKSGRGPKIHQLSFGIGF